MNAEQINGIVRHILGGIGAYLVGRGKLDPAQVELYVGLALAALAVFWSYQAKKPVDVKPAE